MWLGISRFNNLLPSLKTDPVLGIVKPPRVTPRSSTTHCSSVSLGKFPSLPLSLFLFFFLSSCSPNLFEHNTVGVLQPAPIPPGGAGLKKQHRFFSSGP